MYLPEETINKYGVGSKIDLKIDNEVYGFEVTALTFMPNGQGECAMKCHSGYYNLNGQQISNVRGSQLVIQQFIYKNGSTKTCKVLIRRR